MAELQCPLSGVKRTLGLLIQINAPGQKILTRHANSIMNEDFHRVSDDLEPFSIADDTPKFLIT
jgi:hypothetical protein